MDKEEVLRRSREQREDERGQWIQLNANRYALIAALAFVVPMTVFNVVWQATHWEAERPNLAATVALLTVSLAVLGGTSLGSLEVLDDRKRSTVAIVLLILATVSAGLYFLCIAKGW